MKKNAKLSFKTLDGYLFFYPKDILYFKSEDMYAYVHDGKSRQFVSNSLKSLEKILPEKTFVRCHRSYIVNIEKVIKIIKSPEYELLFEKGIKVPVSRSNRKKMLILLGVD